MKNIHYIHIGKCGGSSVELALRQSKFVSSNYDQIIRSHVCGVKDVDNCHYLIVLRNPIERAISAFSWRKKLVVIDQLPDQISRFPGEAKVLKRYKNLSRLAEALYLNGNLDQTVARDFESIHHLRENINFYIAPLLSRLSKENVLGIIVQERLRQDVKRVLHVDLAVSEKKNSVKVDSMSSMSKTALANLKCYLHRDFVSIAELWCRDCLDEEGFKLLLGLNQ